jgi:hypothetical protein
MPTWTNNFREVACGGWASRGQSDITLETDNGPSKPTRFEST